MKPLPKQISNEDWEAIRGSDIHARMILTALPFDFKVVINGQTYRIPEWLADNCSSRYRILDRGRVCFLSENDRALYLLKFLKED